MKPIVIIPDTNQKTITMSIEEFKKIIGEVWEEGYEKGQSVEKINSCSNGFSIAGSLEEDSTISNVIHKRIFNENDSSNFKTNIW